MTLAAATLAARLSVAAAKGELDTVRALVEDAGADVDARAERCDAPLSRWTPLMVAASEGHVEVARWLLENGAALDAKAEGSGDSALALAAYYGHADLVELFVGAGADVDAVDLAGRTPLMAAAEMGHLEAVQLLQSKQEKLDGDAVLSAATTDALLLAARNGHLDIVDALVSHSISSRSDGGEVRAAVSPSSLVQELAPAFVCAAGRGHTQVVEFLVQAAVVVVDESEMVRQACALVNAADASGCTALRVAAGNAHLETVRALLELGADMETSTSDGWTPLLSAAKNGHHDIVELLVVNGAQVDATNKGGGSAMYVAAFEGHLRCVRALVEMGGARIDLATADGWTPLMGAAKMNKAAVIDYLLSIDDHTTSAVVDARKHDGGTALFIAALQGSLEALVALVEAGADLEAADDERWTPLMCAAENGHIECVHILVAHAANLDARSNEQDTALILAAYYGHERVVRALAAFGADRRAKDNDGRTALVAAAESGHVFVVQELLAKDEKDLDADAAIAESIVSDRVAALHRAVTSGHLDVVRSLLETRGKDQATTRTLIETPRAADRRSVLVIAATCGHTDILQFLLSVDGNCTEAESVRTRRAKALRAAAWHGHLDCVRKLVENGGVDVDATNKDGWTPLMCAARNGHVEVMRYLVTQGARVDMDATSGLVEEDDEEWEVGAAALMRAESGASPMPLAC